MNQTKNHYAGKIISTTKLSQNWTAEIKSVISVNDFKDGNISIEFIDITGNYRYWKSWTDGGTLAQ